MDRAGRAPTLSGLQVADRALHVVICLGCLRSQARSPGVLGHRRPGLPRQLGRVDEEAARQAAWAGGPQRPLPGLPVGGRGELRLAGADAGGGPRRGRLGWSRAAQASATETCPANSLPLSQVIARTGTPGAPKRATGARPTSSAVLPSARTRKVNFVALSTAESMAPRCFPPTIPSASQSPARDFSSTNLGRSEMSVRFGTGPRPERRPPFQFGFFPHRRRCMQRSPPASPSAGPPCGAGRRHAPGSSPAPASPRRGSKAPALSCAASTRRPSGVSWPCPGPASSSRARRRHCGRSPGRSSSGTDRDHPRSYNSTIRLPSRSESDIFRRMAILRLASEIVAAYWPFFNNLPAGTFKSRYIRLARFIVPWAFKNLKFSGIFWIEADR